MMDKETLKFLSKQPTSKVIRRIRTLALNKICRFLNIEYNKRIEIPNNYNFPSIKNSFININSVCTTGLKKDVTKYHINQYLNHRFDLLGSGWVEYSYPSQSLGIEGVKFKIPDICYEQKEKLIEYIVPGSHLDNSKRV